LAIPHSLLETVWRSGSRPLISMRAVRRIRAIGPLIVNDVHVNPNAGHREIWIRDLDGYLVVLAEPYG
jgi:hypothetical protein